MPAETYTEFPAGCDFSDAIRFCLKQDDPGAVSSFPDTGYRTPLLRFESGIDWLTQARDIALAVGKRLVVQAGVWSLEDSPHEYPWPDAPPA